MNSKELIEKLGDTSAVALMLGIKPPSVSAWKQAGIPDDKLIKLAVVCEQRGIATREQLFPDSYWLIWPDLPAPAVVEAHQINTPPEAIHDHP